MSIRLTLVSLGFGLILLPSPTATITATPLPPLMLTATPAVTFMRPPTSIAQPTATTKAMTSVPAPPIAPSLPSPGKQARSSTTVTMAILADSTLGWPIELYRFGAGATRVVFVGGIHGGAEANTIQLAYRAVDHFTTHPEDVPPALTIYIIPTANPDGLARLIGHAGRFHPDELSADTTPGRFNGNGVDLNRNWGCDWQPTGFWQHRTVSAGSASFSEGETAILRDFLSDPPAQGVVFWHSAVPGVFAGGCDARFTAADTLARLYADAAGYPFFLSFDAYPVTGDAVNWLATQKIPAIEVELATHSDTEWERNLQGILAILRYFAQKSNRS